MRRVLRGDPEFNPPPGTVRTAIRRGFRVVFVTALLAPAPVDGQQPDCRLVSVGGYTHSQRYDARFGPSEYRHFASGGVDYRCSDGTRVRADSAVVFESDNQVQLYGSVIFEDPDTELRADSATYFSSFRRLTARSGVVVTDRASGTVIRGDNLIYDQASEFRALDKMFVYDGNPRATFFVSPAPAPEEPPEPDSAEAGPPPEEEAPGLPSRRPHRIPWGTPPNLPTPFRRCHTISVRSAFTSRDAGTSARVAMSASCGTLSRPLEIRLTTTRKRA